eukprot:5705732-Pleurochrysis_carterae.AAC.1
MNARADAVAALRCAPVVPAPSFWALPNTPCSSPAGTHTTVAVGVRDIGTTRTAARGAGEPALVRSVSALSPSEMVGSAP